MREAISSVVPLSTELNLETFCRLVCMELGEGFHVQQPAGGGADRVYIWTPERGCLSAQRRGEEILFQAADWPVVEQLGLRRTFSRTIAARISITRDIHAAARDLERRVVRPFQSALAEARHQADAYRSLLNDIAECLELCGLGPGDAHTVGRTVQARRPLIALEQADTRVPSQCTTTISIQEHAAFGSFEARYLSLQELAELNRFVDELVARRDRVLRLSA